MANSFNNFEEAGRYLARAGAKVIFQKCNLLKYMQRASKTMIHGYDNGFNKGQTVAVTIPSQSRPYVRDIASNDDLDLSTMVSDVKETTVNFSLDIAVSEIFSTNQFQQLFRAGEDGDNPTKVNPYFTSKFANIALGLERKLHDRVYRGMPQYLANGTSQPTTATWISGKNQASYFGGDVNKAITSNLNRISMAADLKDYAGYASTNQSKNALDTGMIASFGDFDMWGGNVLAYHTTGTATVATISGTLTSGATTLPIAALSGTLKKGDVLDCPTLLATDASDGNVYQTVLRKVVVTADVASGATSIPIYPPLIPTSSVITSLVVGSVNALPTSGDVFTKRTISGYQGLMFGEETFMFASAPLEQPAMNASGTYARVNIDGLTITIESFWDTLKKTSGVRMDIIAGVQLLRPDQACRVLVPAI